jgi:hypothetical protein
MSDLAHPSVRQLRRAELRAFPEGAPVLSLLRKHVASNRPTWLPLVLVLVAIAAVAYADHRVVVPSLLYLYILPLTISAVRAISMLSRLISTPVVFQPRDPVFC